MKPLAHILKFGVGTSLISAEVIDNQDSYSFFK